ncbi:MAG: DarT ssDNA thymidine ADP-ribosyltransferase family protein [Hyphomicrobiales bacterium]|nr:DarT ssDNA thymidine ADP-ribosyltransferase family protein [Hyphomicrobiales bacterium]
MNAAIKQSATQRNITRLCHFTPSRNLVHIATDPRGVLATSHLEEGDRAVFNATDLVRLDGHREHVCCSVQVPNAWYFRIARTGDRIFHDWVVLFIAPHYLWMDGTKFCHRNAAAQSGEYVAPDHATFEGMFAPSVVGAYGRERVRTAERAACLPTDEQAEVLIPDQVVREDVLGIAVKNESQAKREVVRFQTLQQRIPRIVIVEEFFNAEQLSATLRSGSLPTEEEYYPGDSNG